MDKQIFPLLKNLQECQDKLEYVDNPKEPALLAKHVKEMNADIELRELKPLQESQKLYGNNELKLLSLKKTPEAIQKNLLPYPVGIFFKQNKDDGKFKEKLEKLVNSYFYRQLETDGKYLDLVELQAEQSKLQAKQGRTEKEDFQLKIVTHYVKEVEEKYQEFTDRYKEDKKYVEK